MRKRIVVALVAALMAAGTVTAVAASDTTPVDCTIEANVLSCPLPDVAPVTVTETVAPVTATATATVTTIVTTTQQSPAPVITSPTPTPEPTTAASTTTPAATTSPASWAPSGFPDATNTGWLNGGADGKTAGAYAGVMTARGAGVRLTTSGQTLTHQSFIGGTTYIQAPNVTCNGCLFRANRNTVGSEGAVVLVMADGFTCNYCTVEGTGQIVNEEVADPGGYTAAFLMYGNNARISYTDVSGAGTNVALVQQSHDITVEHSYFHAPAYPSGSDHTSIMNMAQNQSPPGNVRNIKIHHNYLDGHRDNTQGIGFQGQETAQFLYTNVQITDNMLMGSGYVLAEFRKNLNVAGSSNWRQATITGNVFSTRWFAQSGKFGAVYMSAGAVWPSGDGSLWKNNRWYVPAGSPGNPADNGKYLLPQGGTVLSSTDFVQH